MAICNEQNKGKSLLQVHFEEFFLRQILWACYYWYLRGFAAESEPLLREMLCVRKNVKLLFA